MAKMLQGGQWCARLEGQPALAFPVRFHGGPQSISTLSPRGINLIATRWPVALSVASSTNPKLPELRDRACKEGYEVRREHSGRVG